jgi:hypothetical protein
MHKVFESEIISAFFQATNARDEGDRRWCQHLSSVVARGTAALGAIDVGWHCDRHVCPVLQRPPLEQSERQTRGWHYDRRVCPVLQRAPLERSKRQKPLELRDRRVPCASDIAQRALRSLLHATDASYARATNAGQHLVIPAMASWFNHISTWQTRPMDGDGAYVAPNSCLFFWRQRLVSTCGL